MSELVAQTVTESMQIHIVLLLCVCARVYACVCVRACVHACVRAYVGALGTVPLINNVIIVHLSHFVYTKRAISLNLVTPLTDFVVQHVILYHASKN